MAATKARIGAAAPGALYGRGVFTTVAVHNGRPFLWAENWYLLAEQSERIGIGLSEFSEDGTLASLLELISANDARDAAARIALLARAGDASMWGLNMSGRQSDLVIMTAPLRTARDEGLSLTISPARANTHSPLSGIRSINYLEHVLAREEAGRRDFDEAVILNERGEIVSASMASIFWARDGKLHTPALATGTLPGATRACIIRLAADLSIPLIEGAYPLADLMEADEIFLASAEAGIGVVTTFDYRRYTIAMGSLAARLREALRQLAIDVVSS